NLTGFALTGGGNPPFPEPEVTRHGKLAVFSSPNPPSGPCRNPPACGGPPAVTCPRPRRRHPPQERQLVRGSRHRGKRRARGRLHGLGGHPSEMGHPRPHRPRDGGKEPGA